MTDQPPKPRRRWFQFSMRSLLIVVTLVAGLLVAWRVYVEPYRRQRETMALITGLGGFYEAMPGGPSWLRGLFGDENFQNIIEISLSADYDTIWPEKEVSEADLSHLEGLTNLRRLYLSPSQVSDAGVEKLQEALPNCAIFD